MDEEEKLPLTKEVFLQEFVLDAIEGGADTNGKELVKQAIVAWKAIRSEVVNS